MIAPGHFAPIEPFGNHSQERMPPERKGAGYSEWRKLFSSPNLSSITLRPSS